MPELREGEATRSSRRRPGVITEQKFTQPPPRYNEGSLVRELEKRGIGRPSTYAEIIGKVQQRAYVEKLRERWLSAVAARQVRGRWARAKSNLDFMDPGFTAQMEEELDEVGAGQLKRVHLLQRFYKRFRDQLDKSKKLASWKPESIKTDIVCDECGAKMNKKWGKNGWFLSCERYPRMQGNARPCGRRRAQRGAGDQHLVRQVRQAHGHQDRPLRRVLVVHGVSCLQERASGAAGRAVSQVRGRHHRDQAAQARRPHVLWVLQLQRRPKVRLQALAASGSSAMPQVRRQVLDPCGRQETHARVRDQGLRIQARN